MAFIVTIHILHVCQRQPASFMNTQHFFHSWDCVFMIIQPAVTIFSDSLLGTDISDPSHEGITGNHLGSAIGIYQINSII